MIDTFYSFFIILVFVFLYVFTIYIQTFLAFKKDYKKYKCNPMIIPFSGVFGENPQTVFNECVSEQSNIAAKQQTQSVRDNISHASSTSSSTTNLTSGMIESNGQTKNAMFGMPSMSTPSIGSDGESYYSSSMSSSSSTPDMGLFGATLNLQQQIAIQNIKMASASKAVMDTMMANFKTLIMTFKAFPTMARGILNSPPIKIVRNVGRVVS